MARMEMQPDDDLFAHQRFPVQYWTNNQEQRSIGLFMEPGTGKTRVMALIADAFPGEHVLYMAPKSLKRVFLNELAKAGKDNTRVDSNGLTRYHHISSNAGNVYTQWMDYVSLIGFESIRSSNGEHVEPSLLIIIDEAHILSQRIARILNRIHFEPRYSAENDPKEKGAYKLYLDLRSAINIKCIMATGSPILNDPFDAVPMLNIMRGPITDLDDTLIGYAFPDIYSRFYFSFIKGTPTPENRLDLLFASRVQSMIYWYRIPRGIPTLPIPDIISDDVIKLPMRALQWSRYQEVKAFEESLEDKVRFSTPSEGVPMVGNIGIFKSFTRQASNFTYDSDLRLVKNKIDRLDDEQLTLKSLEKSGVKIWGILVDIMKNKRIIHGVYSHFVNDYGISVLERAMNVLGWKSLESDNVSTIEELAKLVVKDKKPRYMSLTGKQSVVDKDRMLSIMNTELNAKKRLVRTVFFSGAAGLGLSIFSVERVHVLEPDWSVANENQAVNRFARLFSHRYLPSSRRKLKVFRYVAVDPGDSGIITTDLHVRSVAQRKERNIITTLAGFASASIACKALFTEESALAANVIKSKRVPPVRNHTNCRMCASELVPSILLQMGIGLKCNEIMPPKPASKHGLTVEFEDRRYVLDKKNGLGWTDSKTLIVDVDLLRALWRKAIE